MASALKPVDDDNVFKRQCSEDSSEPVVSQPSKCLNLRTFREGCFVVSNLMQVLYDALETFDHHSLGKINEDDLNEWDDYGVPFSEQQYTHRSCYISLFKCKYFDKSDPPG